ncbi:MAG: MFS transporter [Thermoleophilaceae bacterium]
MRETLALLRHENRARLFFVALAQSALGTGAGYIALLLIAYERFESPWAISLVLVADLVPAMLLGPVFGAVADRWSRKGALVLADIVRLVAFAGIALADTYLATIAFAMLAGAGTGLATPAALAALPSVVDDARRVPAATALYGAVADLGFTLGPAVAAGALALVSPETLMAANAASFGASALLLSRLRFGAAPEKPVGAIPASLLQDARDGLRATTGMRAVRVVLLASSAALFGAGVFNVAELFFATEELGTSNAGFSALVTFFGIGFIGGSLAGSRGGPAPLLKRRYLTGLVVFGAGFWATGVAPGFAIALLTFAAAGFGNGLVLVYERLLIQASVPDGLVGRVFGVKDALSAWAFALAFLAGGALLEALGPREAIGIAGSVAVVAWAVSIVALRNEWSEPDAGAGDGDLRPGLAADELAAAVTLDPRARR